MLVILLGNDVSTCCILIYQTKVMPRQIPMGEQRIEIPKPRSSFECFSHRSLLVYLHYEWRMIDMTRVYLRVNEVKKKY